MSDPSGKMPFHLIWVTHRERYPKADLPLLFQKTLVAGLSAVILREKQLPSGEIYRLARKLAELAKLHQAQVAVADRVDICCMLGLDWLHLPEDSPPLSSIRGFLANKVFISKSVHSLDKAREAEEEGVDFLIAGSIFPTRSHAGGILGLTGLEQICASVSVPVLAIGGITSDNVFQVRSVGAAGVAVVGTIYDSTDLNETIHKLQKPWF